MGLRLGFLTGTLLMQLKDDTTGGDRLVDDSDLGDQVGRCQCLRSVSAEKVRQQSACGLTVNLLTLSVAVL